MNLNGNAKCKRKRKKRVLKRIESFQSNRIYNQARESEQRDFHFSVQRSCDFYPGRSFFKVCSTFFLNKFPKKKNILLTYLMGLRAWNQMILDASSFFKKCSLILLKTLLVSISKVTFWQISLPLSGWHHLWMAP